MESFWTYELCHGKHIRQYHDERDMVDKKVKKQEYFLGKWTDDKTEKKSRYIFKTRKNVIICWFFLFGM